jgi:sec-independent protein translocase protein TatB
MTSDVHRDLCYGRSMFGLTLDKLVVVGVVAAFLVGPSRLPALAATLAGFVRRLRSTADGLKARVDEEVGEEIDWKRLDPRRYDPRSIVRSALADPAPPRAAQTPGEDR